MRDCYPQNVRWSLMLQNSFERLCERMSLIGEYTDKNFLRKFKKAIDMFAFVWYNILDDESCQMRP